MSRYILKEHMVPFLFALLILVFVLLANFLLKSIDKFLGKGLDILVLLEFVFLNLAWILALAVPMAVLVATLMTFGRMSADNEITAIRSSGISYRSLLFPSVGFGLIITIAMMFFNNQILPEMNHNARLLSADISRKHPDLEFEVGYFNNTLPDHSILLGGREKNGYTDITIFGKGETGSSRTIIANFGSIETIEWGVILHLEDGVIHQLAGNPDEYQQIYFQKYQVIVPIDNLTLTRKDSKIRGDREMTFEMIQNKISDYRNKISSTWERIDTRLNNEAKLNILHQRSKEVIQYQLTAFEMTMTDSLEKVGDKSITNTFNRRFSNLQRGINGDFRLIDSYMRSINKYRVELHKKFSIPVASIVFILIGAPLGIMARRGGFAMSLSVSLGFFILYWSFLIAGEELADRGLLAPFISMWLPNMFLGVTGIFLCYYTAKEQHTFNLELFNIFKINGKNSREHVTDST